MKLNKRYPNFDLDAALYKAWTLLKIEQSRVYLGIWWWVFEPILYMSVFYFVFEYALGMGGEGFVYFLLCGLVPWKWFSSSISSSLSLIQNNKAIILKIHISKHILFVSSFISEFVKFLIVFVLFLLFLILTDHEPSWRWMMLIPLIFIQALLTYSLACFLGVLITFIPDLKVVVANILQLLFFLSGIFFYIDEKSEIMFNSLYFNPIANLIFNYRAILLDTTQFEVIFLFISLFMSIIMLVISILFLRISDKKIPKFI
jgi:lipopolysaccharide transport system permease protein